MAEQREAKVINVSKTVEYLNRAFQEACRGLPLAQVAGNYKEKAGVKRVVRWTDPTERELDAQRHHNWQVDMAYMINDIQRGPSYIVPKVIADCNKLIEDVRQYRSQKTEKAAS